MFLILSEIYVRTVNLVPKGVELKKLIQELRC